MSTSEPLRPERFCRSGRPALSNPRHPDGEEAQEVRGPEVVSASIERQTLPKKSMRCRSSLSKVRKPPAAASQSSRPLFKGPSYSALPTARGLGRAKLGRSVSGALPGDPSGTRASPPRLRDGGLGSSLEGFRLRPRSIRHRPPAPLPGASPFFRTPGRRSPDGAPLGRAGSFSFPHPPGTTASPGPGPAPLPRAGSLDGRGSFRAPAPLQRARSDGIRRPTSISPHAPLLPAGNPLSPDIPTSQPRERLAGLPHRRGSHRRKAPLGADGFPSP